MDHMGLNGQIVADEFGGVGVVRVNATHLCCCEDDVRRSLRFEEALDSQLIREIELRVGARDQILITLALQSSDNGRSGQATMAGDIDL